MGDLLHQDLLASMKLRPELRKLIREAVRIAWEKKKAVNEDVLSAARKRIGALRSIANNGFRGLFSPVA